jgi:hypothetical protein
MRVYATCSVVLCVAVNRLHACVVEGHVQALQALVAKGVKRRSVAALPDLTCFRLDQ